MHQADRSDSSASAAVQVIDGLFSSPARAHHAVQFYESEDFLCDVVARYLNGGLRAGEPAVLLITPERARGIFKRLKKGEYDVEGGLASGQLTLFDARETLGKFMVADMPDWCRFKAVVGGVLERSVARGCGMRVRAVGEMVDVLWREGNPQAAIRLEEMWNDLGKSHSFTLLCAYVMGNFFKERHGEQFRRVCETHSHVIPAETWSSSDDPEIQLREVSILQQRAGALQAEVKQRQELEEALRDALANLRRSHEALAFLAEASALLSSSLDHETTLASLANLLVPRIADGCAVELARDPSMPKGSVVAGRFAPGAGPGPAIASVLRSGRSVMHHAVLAVPMAARGRVLGAIALGSAQPDRRFELSDLEMAEELGRRAALAVENARLYREAREADRRKDEFLALLGHELRNPLAPILTALQLMQLRGTGDEREHKMIERQVRHLNRLIDDLLDVSRITRGKVQLKKEPLELSAVLAKAIEMASPLFEQRSHALSIDVPREGLVVDGDPVRLAQVFANLLVNAAKYTEPGGKIALTARREKNRLSVSVKDNGIGIAPEVLPKVFDLFVQAERALDRSQGGLGIGLALARNLVDLHGGTIAAHSEGPGKGSEFVARLPLSPTRATPADASAAGTPAPARDRSGLRILLVDDNLDAVDVLAEALRTFGHEVVVAHDGPEALTLARDFRPNTALLDIGLPVMDGYELAAALRKAQGSEPLRLIALTGYGQDADKARSHGAGFDVHLVKPIDLDAVEALLEAN